MVIEPFDRMGPLPRSHAAEANDCFMVRPQHGANRIQGCSAKFRAQWRAPLGSCRRARSVVQGAFSKPRKHKYEQTGQVNPT
jgi:hypothetical protein